MLSFALSQRFSLLRASLVLLLAVGAAGCVSLTGRPFGQYVDDTAISAKVKMRLVGLGAGTLTRVHVDTYKGIVYLSGDVETAETKKRVEGLAAGVEHVVQVVNNIHAREENGRHRRPDDAVAASPDTSPAAAQPTLGAAAPASAVPVRPAAGLVRPAATLARPASVVPPPSPRLADDLPGFARLDVEDGAGLAGPFCAYDAAGRLVATVYVVPIKELALSGEDRFTAGDRPVDHVTIDLLPSRPDVPEPYYSIVLWHVTRAEAAALSR